MDSLKPQGERAHVSGGGKMCCQQSDTETSRRWEATKIREFSTQVTKQSTMLAWFTGHAMLPGSVHACLPTALCFKYAFQEPSGPGTSRGIEDVHGPSQGAPESLLEGLCMHPWTFYGAKMIASRVCKKSAMQLGPFSRK